MSRPLPDIAELVGFDHAVAGHDGTLTDPAGELFVKPCTETEIAFYELTAAHYPAFTDIIPTFLGTLTLSASETQILDEISTTSTSQTDPPTSTTPAADTPDKLILHHKFIKTKRIITDRAIVLDNAAHGFHRPNILDVKLGVRLWADDAPAEKRARFDKITAETTHASHGFRVAGMRVWQGHDAPRGGHVDAEGYKIYDKNYGREEIGAANVGEAFREFVGARSAGVDGELARLVAQAFLAEVEEVQRVLEGVETRMYSASLLFVYEGDGEALRAAMEEASRPVDVDVAEVHGGLVNGEVLTNGVGIAELVNGVTDGDADGEDDEGEDEDEELPPKIYSVKLIDFAHAEFVPGQGPDENSLKGVRSIAEILRGIAEEVEEGEEGVVPATPTA